MKRGTTRERRGTPSQAEKGLRYVSKVRGILSLEGKRLGQGLKPPERRVPPLLPLEEGSQRNARRACFDGARRREK